MKDPIDTMKEKLGTEKMTLIKNNGTKISDIEVIFDINSNFIIVTDLSLTISINDTFMQQPTKQKYQVTKISREGIKRKGKQLVKDHFHVYLKPL